MTIGENIKRIRKEKGLTQKQLTTLCGLSYSTVCKLESGEFKNPSLETIQNIADALGVNIADLMGYNLSSISTKDLVTELERRWNV